MYENGRTMLDELLSDRIDDRSLDGFADCRKPVRRREQFFFVRDLQGRQNVDATYEIVVLTSGTGLLATEFSKIRQLNF